MKTARRLSAAGQRLSTVGLILGTLFFAFSLTPSLLPRPFVFQGIVSGLLLTLGYALGVGGRWLWSYLELPHPDARTGRVLTRAAAAICIAVGVTFLWQASEWQNSVRRLMEMPEEGGVRPLSVALIALLLFGVLLRLARRFHRTFLFFTGRLDRFLPPRVSHVLGITAAVILFWGIIDGVFVALGLRVADRISQQVDATIPPDLERPDDPAKTGSRESFIAWEDLGYQGRAFVASGPTAEELTAFFGEATPAPIRVYVGLHAAATPEVFGVRSLYREPEWMREPRGPDVSPALRWYPVVTMVQLAADLAVATAPPPGYGHNVAAAHYIDAWHALMDPKGWTEGDLRRLKALHATKHGSAPPTRLETAPEASP